MMMNHEHKETPHDTLISALEKVEEMQDVLVIYRGKDGFKSGVFDSDLKISDALLIVECFRYWLISGMRMGDAT